MAFLPAKSWSVTPRRDIQWNDLALEGLKQERRIRTDETVRTGNQDAGIRHEVPPATMIEILGVEVSRLDRPQPEMSDLFVVEL